MVHFARLWKNMEKNSSTPPAEGMPQIKRKGRVLVLKICGFLSLVSYFLAFVFVVIVGEICPSAIENDITVFVFFILVLAGAVLALMQSNERFDRYIFLKNDKMTDEDYDELIRMIEERKKELSA